MVTKKSPPATKNDLLVIEKRIGKRIKGLEQKIEDCATKDDLLQCATKDDLLQCATKDDLRQCATKDDLRHFAKKDDLRQMEERLMHYFDLKTENVVYDFKGIFNDRTVGHEQRLSDHESRITRVERKVGIPL